MSKIWALIKTIEIAVVVLVGSIVIDITGEDNE